jgi:hypothetical protein
MDFYYIAERPTKDDAIELYPDFKVGRSKDLMIRAKSFYAIWDEKAGLWSTDEYDVQRLIDEDLFRHKEALEKKTDKRVRVKTAGNFSSGIWQKFRGYMALVSDSSKPLDEILTFSNTKVKKSDHVSRRLPYPLEKGEVEAWSEIISTLYDPEERAKLEWAIGAIVSGDAKRIQKFLVLYGPPGSGKGTMINILIKMFAGYYTTFEAKALGSNNGAFATEAFKTNPLVAIQHDGDLSKIEDNTLLNSIISHEEIRINEKFKPSYDAIVNAFLFMGTNKPVKISDAKSGIIRRLIDVQPSGRKLSPRRYQALMSQVDFELGAIAWHCLEVYREMGKHFYDGYRPVEMMLQTDVFYNFIEANYDVFKEQDGATLSQAFNLFKKFREDTDLEFKMPQFKFREELRNYFENFEERAIIDGGVRVRSWYSGFKTDQFKVQDVEEAPSALSLDEDISLFDELASSWTAQYANKDENPVKAWDNVSTTLADIDTSKTHYVRTPLNHIVIDFDLKDENGDKSVELNLAAASQWPPTYTEYSKGGGGVHLHYDYDGDVAELSRVYAEDIEVKVFTGKQALRRRFTKGNNIPVARINSGLPLKEKKVINAEQVKSEKGLRDLIIRNLKKEIHPGTKPSVDFIKKILDDAYDSGLNYDLTNMRNNVIAFSNNSSNHALECLRTVGKMKFKGKDVDEPQKAEPLVPATFMSQKSLDDRIVFYDVEVFPNLFVICWKYEGSDQVVTMINPTAAQVEELFQYKLVGFNNRKYDNHIIYAASLGYSLEQLYRLSQKIVNNVPGALFGAAYDLSWTDIYDYSTIKQGLKKFQISLGLPHHELGLPWDEPVPKEMWEKVAEYCRSDVHTTDAVFQDRRPDYIARQILADMSGLSINASTLQHTAHIIFQGNRKPQDQFNYTKLSEQFPGYEYGYGKSTYRGEEVGEGGLVRAKPGMYKNVALLDIASMHPTSIKVLDLFGPYTKNFTDIMDARLAIKRGNYDEAKTMLNGILAKHLGTPEEAEKLAYSLKIAINIVYGLTSAKFENPFKDPRNVDNIVAKRGALFMMDLNEAVNNFVGRNGEKWEIVHIKTDSVKIPDATKEIIDFVMEFGSDYGYTFEHEATYERMCLVNDAVYIAKVAAGRKPGYWQATGAQFQHPYVFKKLFSKEPLDFNDLCETKSVTSSLYLDKTEDQTSMDKENPRIEDLDFVGKVGQFTPVLNNGGLLVREKNGKFYSATGTKGHLWAESHVVEHIQDDIDMSYFDKLVNKAVENIQQFGDFEWLVDDDGQ